MTEAQKKLEEALKMTEELQRAPVTRAQLKLAQTRTAAALRNTVAVVCVVMALSIAGIWWIYGSSVSAVPQSASFVWKDDQSCVYRTRYVLSTGRTLAIDAEVSGAACPANPNLSSLWVRPGGASPLPGR